MVVLAFVFVYVYTGLINKSNLLLINIIKFDTMLLKNTSNAREISNCGRLKKRLTATTIYSFFLILLWHIPMQKSLVEFFQKPQKVLKKQKQTKRCFDFRSTFQQLVVCALFQCAFKKKKIFPFTYRGFLNFALKKLWT